MGKTYTSSEELSNHTLKWGDLVKFGDIRYSVSQNFLSNIGSGFNDEIFEKLNIDKRRECEQLFGRTYTGTFPDVDSFDKLTKLVMYLFKEYEKEEGISINESTDTQTDEQEDTSERIVRQDKSLTLSNNVRPFDGIAIEPEISTEFYNKNFINLNVHSESENIKELCGLHDEDRETIINTIDIIGEQYKYNATIGSNGYMSNGVHFHIFLNDNQYNAIQTGLIHNNLKYKILNTPLFAKPVSYMGKRYLLHRHSNYVSDLEIKTDSKSAIISKKRSYYSHDEEEYSIDGQSIEFRMNGVFDFRLTGYYYYLTYCLMNDEEALNMKFKRLNVKRIKLLGGNMERFPSSLQDVPNELIIAKTKETDRIEIDTENIKIILSNVGRIVSFLKSKGHDTIAEDLQSYAVENFIN